eukprot:GHRR01029440.1.p1 GENE.GHRR01029440.1~~GHRR01029440.1.p1  ORF type:complete len:145 (+),score=24.67 GHRR01029440.1:610-1044(+)
MVHTNYFHGYHCGFHPICVPSFCQHFFSYLLLQALEGPGEGRVLIVDGGDSDRCALVGDALADLAVKNNWKGIVVNGLIRDSEAISKMAVGVKALGTHPLKSDKAAADQGQQQVDVVISGCKISPGDWIYADWDGVVVSKKQLQ